MNNPNLSKLIAGLLLSCLVGCGYSPLHKEPATEDLAGIYLPGHSVVVNAKNAYRSEDLLDVHITLLPDRSIEAVLPDGWRSPMETDGKGLVEHYSGTWSIEKNSAGKPALALTLKNTKTQEDQIFNLTLAQHSDQIVIGLNVITDKTKWFGFSSVHIQKDVWFRRKNDKLDAYLEKNLSAEKPEA